MVAVATYPYAVGGVAVPDPYPVVGRGGCVGFPSLGVARGIGRVYSSHMGTNTETNKTNRDLIDQVLDLWSEPYATTLDGAHVLLDTHAYGREGDYLVFRETGVQGCTLVERQGRIPGTSRHTSEYRAIAASEDLAALTVSRRTIDQLLAGRVIRERPADWRDLSA